MLHHVLNNAINKQSAFLGPVLALLWRNPLDTKEAPDQHAGGWEQRLTQTEVSSFAQDQRILGNCPKPQRNWWVSVIDEVFKYGLQWMSGAVSWVRCVSRLVQLQLFMIPLWTSETTKRQPCLESLTGRNTTPTYTWGTKKPFTARIAAFHFLLTGVTGLYRRDLTSPPSCRRIPLELIPEGEAECAAWLHKLYQEKVRACWRWKVMHTRFPTGDCLAEGESHPDPEGQNSSQTH